MGSYHHSKLLFEKKYSVENISKEQIRIADSAIGNRKFAQNVPPLRASSSQRRSIAVLNPISKTVKGLALQPYLKLVFAYSSPLDLICETSAPPGPLS